MKEKPYAFSQQLGVLASLLSTAILPLITPFAMATTTRDIEATSIAAVALNGGADTANPGTTCIRISNPLPTACNHGYVAIPNNNKQLVAAALHGKLSGSRISLYMTDDSGAMHCPGIVFSRPCKTS